MKKLLGKHLTLGWDLGHRMRLQAYQACRKLRYKERNIQIRGHIVQNVLYFFGSYTNTFTFTFLLCAIVAPKLHLVPEEVTASLTTQCNRQESVPIYRTGNYSYPDEGFKMFYTVSERWFFNFMDILEAVCVSCL